MKPLSAAVGCLALLVSLGAARAQELPPGHPPLDQVAGKKAPPLPPDAPQTLPSGHPPVAAEPQLSEKELLQKLDAAKGLKEQDKPFEVALNLGKLYYGRTRYADSADYLDQAAKMAEPARTFYLEQRKKARLAKKPLPEAQAAGCARGPDSTLAQLSATARDKAGAGDTLAAAACARSAIEPLAEAYGLLANARYILGDSKAALAVRDRQLETFDGDPGALFARGVMLLDTQGDDPTALERARADFARLVKESPASPQAARAGKLLQRVNDALAAGGIGKLAKKEAEARKAAAPAPAPATGELQITPQMMEAVQNTERTPELAAGFAKLLDEAEEHLARGRYQDALANCSRVVPFEPENARARSGMAWALVKLDKQPMADRVWTLAASADPGALDKLGDTLKTKGDASGAKALWTKLGQSAPDYAGKAKLADKLK